MSMKEENEILSKIDKQTGFTVPEGYFSDFAKNMEQVLPEKSFVDDSEPTRWQRMRPYVYMAAMFAGIWCMMNIFGRMASQSDSEATLAAETQEEEYIEEYILSNSYCEYDLMLALEESGYNMY